MLPLRWNGKARLEGAWLARQLRGACPTSTERVGRRKPSSSASPALGMKALLLLVLPWLSPANYIDNVGNLHLLYSELWVRAATLSSCSLSVCLTWAAGRFSPLWGSVCLSVCAWAYVWRKSRSILPIAWNKAAKQLLHIPRANNSNTSPLLSAPKERGSS